MNLNTTNWKEFVLGRLFVIKKGKRLTSAEQEDGDNNYIGAIDSNNGIANHIAQAPIHKGNTISLSYNGSVGEAFYQKDPYWATDDVNVLYSKYEGFNEQIGLFIATVLKQEKYKFSYGRKWTLNNMNITIIKLPAKRNVDGTIYLDTSKKYSEEGYIPDWEWMENYIKSLHHKPLTTKNKSENIPQLDVEKWKEFHVGKLFNINRGKTLSSENKEEFIGDDYSCINGGSVNNGELCKMSKELQEIGFILQEVPSLSLSRVGNAGLTFLQTEPYYIADNAFSLVLNKQKNKFVYLFLSTCLNSEVFKYSYGRTISSEKYMLTAIKLPVQHNADGTIFIDDKHTYSEEGYVPDWQFMEDYIKSLPYGDRL